jgi:hypothetical protein
MLMLSSVTLPSSSSWWPDSSSTHGGITSEIEAPTSGAWRRAGRRAAARAVTLIQEPVGFCQQTLHLGVRRFVGAADMHANQLIEFRFFRVVGILLACCSARCTDDGVRGLILTCIAAESDNVRRSPQWF